MDISHALTCLRSQGWFTLATESEAESESESQGALRSSVNQKSESEAESEARRNRSQKDQTCFFFFRFRFRFRRFRSSENGVNGIGSGSGIISQSKSHYQSLSNLEQEKKMAAREEKLAEAVRQFPVLYDKSCRDFKDNSKKRLAWEDVAKQVGLQTGMYCSSEYRFICLMFSLVRTMAAVFSGFSVWVLITVFLTLKARLTIPLPSCRFTLDQNFLPIPSPLTTPLPSLPSLV